MSGDRRSHPRAVATALFVTVLWSTSWVLIRVGLDEEALTPLTFAALRYGLAAVVLASVLVSRPAQRAAMRRLGRTEIGGIALLGVVLYAVTQGAQFVAIDSQPAATTSLVLSLTPLLVAGSAIRTLSEIPSPRQVAGAVLVAGGAWAYFSGDLGATLVGMVAAVVGLGANAAAALLGRHVNRSATVPPLVVTAIGMAVGAVVLVATGIVVEGVPSVSPRGWGIVAWLAVVNTALAFTLWNRSLQRLGAVESAGINNTMLVQIALLGWAFLGERPGAGEWTGIVLVAIGVFLTQVGGPVRPDRRGPG